MDFAFNSGASKLEKEHQKRREAAVRKLNQQRQSEQRNIEKQLLLKELAKLQKLEQDRLEQERLEKEQEEFQLTGGISVNISNCIPYLIEGEDDKVILSESVLNDLINKDAISKGPIVFRLVAKVQDASSENTNFKEVITHVGVREFTAVDNAIGITQKVLNSIVTLSEKLSSSIADIQQLQLSNILALKLKYVMLPKITYVKLSAENINFFDVGPIKSCLEENLSNHLTLTVQDVVTIWYRGKSYRLKVTEMKTTATNADNLDKEPGDQNAVICGSLFNSDVEVDLEIEKSISDAEVKSSDVSTTVTSSGYRLNSELSTQSSATVDDSKLIDDNSVIISISVPPEPHQFVPVTVTTVKFKTSRHGTYTRRFTKDTPLLAVLRYLADVMKEDIRRIQVTAWRNDSPAAVDKQSHMFTYDSLLRAVKEYNNQTDSLCNNFSGIDSFVDDVDISKLSFESLGLTTPQQVFMVNVL